ncbi:hypothetical protein AVEN_230078-1 [Araneus ventricosus]|uniref:Uncharacterized protein n=1 Tax=Araneus ventricosus TaxID=182803 RepID=A0A4Y2H1D5_ARAVE|nr:hypothetical protein AVEN_230078-1 [Araneus ventricosus]
MTREAEKLDPAICTSCFTGDEKGRKYHDPAPFALVKPLVMTRGAKEYHEPGAICPHPLPICLATGDDKRGEIHCAPDATHPRNATGLKFHSFIKRSHTSLGRWSSFQLSSSLTGLLIVPLNNMCTRSVSQNCSKFLPSINRHASLRLHMNWRTLSNKTDISKTFTVEVEILVMKSTNPPSQHS